MYMLILGLHSVLRWLALILGIAAAVLAWLGWLGKGEWKPLNRKLSSFFAISLDVQLVLGLLLYFLFSPITRSALQNFSAAMSAEELRFFALEHPLFMVLALVFAHLGSILPKRASGSEAKFRAAAITTTIAVLLILFGIPWFRPIFPGPG